jgi:hypothetical protein
VYKQQFGKGHEKEKMLALRTVRAPDMEQNFGAPQFKEGGPHLISLFARRFKTPFPYKDFTMLVAAQRGRGKLLEVHQAWRLFDARVNTSGANDLVEYLKRFSDAYAQDVEVDGKFGHFFLEGPRVDTSSQIKFTNKGERVEYYVTQFTQSDPRTKMPRAALTVSINFQAYLDTVRKLDIDEIS